MINSNTGVCCLHFTKDLFHSTGRKRQRKTMQRSRFETWYCSHLFCMFSCQASKKRKHLHTVNSYQSNPIGVVLIWRTERVPFAAKHLQQSSQSDYYYVLPLNILFLFPDLRVPRHASHHFRCSTFKSFPLTLAPGKLS